MKAYLLGVAFGLAFAGLLAFGLALDVCHVGL